MNATVHTGHVVFATLLVGDQSRLVLYLGYCDEFCNRWTRPRVFGVPRPRVLGVPWPTLFPVHSQECLEQVIVCFSWVSPVLILRETVHTDHSEAVGLWDQFWDEEVAS